MFCGAQEALHLRTSLRRKSRLAIFHSRFIEIASSATTTFSLSYHFFSIRSVYHRLPFMFAPSRSLLRYLRLKPYQHPQCQFLQPRLFSTTANVYSGHSRWSKIKHDKAKVDLGKNKQRSILAQELENASNCTIQYSTGLQFCPG